MRFHFELYYKLKMKFSLVREAFTSYLISGDALNFIRLKKYLGTPDNLQICYYIS